MLLSSNCGLHVLIYRFILFIDSKQQFTKEELKEALKEFKTSSFDVKDKQVC